MKKLVGVLAVSSLLLGVGACDHGAAPEANASESQRQAANVPGTSGGQQQTPDANNVAAGPKAAANTATGSAVPVGPADASRPHPQGQQPEQQTYVAQRAPNPGRGDALTAQRESKQKQ